MPIRVFTKENGSHEEWLEVNDDCTVTHHIENSGWAMRGKVDAREKTFSVKEAKEKWAHYAAHIEVALIKVRDKNRI